MVNRSVRTSLVGALISALALAGCTPTTSQNSGSTPSTATPTPAVDYTIPHAAEAALTRLATAAGSKEIIKVELTKTTATIAVVKDETAQTWSYREGKPTRVDGDTQYIGQARFKLDDFDLSDVGEIFRQAADVAKSSENQELQLVEYNGGSVYMTVTTTPESQTVFFRADCVMIPVLDYHTEAGLAKGLQDAISGLPHVTSVGIGAAGVWSDRVGGDNILLRRTRPARFPARTDLRQDKPVGPAFDPNLLDAAVIYKVMAQLRAGRDVPVTVAIDRRNNLRDPVMRFTADNRTIMTDLAGNDITASIR